MKNPTEELTGIYFSLKSWDISLALNMTYFFIRHSERSEESHRRTDGHILFTWVVGYFAYAQYDVLFLYVILSMSSEQTCLQGFANEDIHKALAFFIKNAENGSFNALALSAE